MEIAVDGWRPGAEEWDTIRNIPPEKVPPLTSEQRAVAKKLGVSEVEYAKNALAGERSQERLMAKAERLARLLVKMLKDLGSTAKIDRVVLRIFTEKFDIELKRDGQLRPIRVSEALVDELFETGSEDAEKRLLRIIETAVDGWSRVQ